MYKHENKGLLGFGNEKRGIKFQKAGAHPFLYKSKDISTAYCVNQD